MSARYIRGEFLRAGITPNDKCDRRISEEFGDDTTYMACDYHEGYIDGFETAVGGLKEVPHA